MYNLHKGGSPEATEELISLSSGPSFTAMMYPACIVNGVRFVVEARDAQLRTQNSGVSVMGTDGNIFYGVLQEIMELTYLNSCTVTLFKCKWFDTNPAKNKLYTDKNITSISISGQWYKDDPYILATQAKQVFYVEDLLNGPNWRVVHNIVHRDIWDVPNGGNSAQSGLFLQAGSSSDFNLTVDLGDFHLLNLSARRYGLPISPPAGNVGFRATEDDGSSDDVDSSEDETIENYMDEEPSESDNAEQIGDDDHVTFTDTDSDYET